MTDTSPTPRFVLIVILRPLSIPGRYRTTRWSQPTEFVNVGSGAHYDDLRHGDEEDGYGAAPDYGDWLEYHLTTLDRILTEAGYRKIPLTAAETHPARPRGWRRSTQRLGVVGGEASA